MVEGQIRWVEEKSKSKAAITISWLVNRSRRKLPASVARFLKFTRVALWLQARYRLYFSSAHSPVVRTDVTTKLGFFVNVRRHRDEASRLSRVVPEKASLRPQHNISSGTRVRMEQ